jgi:hypothetical protein
MRLRLLPAALLAPAVLAACASGKRRPAVAAGQGATLEVSNQYLGPLNIYAVRDGGYTRRLGSVYSSRVHRFALGNDLVGAGGAVRIFAVPVASADGRATTGNLMIAPGQTIQFNVATDLRASTTFVR